METKRVLTSDQSISLLTLLQTRFENNQSRHANNSWADVRTKLVGDSEKLWSLYQMEESGGEPDVVGGKTKFGQFLFCDCSPESPLGRRNLCYDRAAWGSRKKNKPRGSAVEVAESMGIDILTEDEYRSLQAREAFDTKTSSWIVTPDEIRKLGGALFCDRRFNHLFVYHNSAESYYGARGFRGSLRV